MAFRTSTRFVLDQRREVIGFLLAAVLAARLLLGDAHTVIVFCWVHVLSLNGFMYTCKGSFIYFSDLCSNFDSYRCAYINTSHLHLDIYTWSFFFICICIYRDVDLSSHLHEVVSFQTTNPGYPTNRKFSFQLLRGICKSQARGGSQTCLETPPFSMLVQNLNPQDGRICLKIKRCYECFRIFTKRQPHFSDQRIYIYI